ncbi:MAG TPA: bifunctional riboflavin kinase/FAD synthetase [Bryobacteraceae bacterium]|nr:bifunctional riboflavin kinase/FAD synthetase [Bryobacteraceae bacterium]
MIRAYWSLDEIGPEAHGCAVSIGNFDGVHAGHRRIFRRVVELAQERGLKPSVLTFEPHPTRVVAPARAPRLLSTPKQRIQFMEQEGIQQAFVLPFDLTFSQLTPERFADEILARGLGAKAVLVGDNFRFGNKQAGHVDTLRALGARLAFEVEVVPGLHLRGRMVSSSEARTAIEAGDVSRACRYLERSYTLEGSVVPGQGIGSKKTVPTLNLQTSAEVLPATGVYITATRCLDTHRRWNSITNIGYRPTFEGKELTIETVLLDPLVGETPKRIEVAFLRRLREERKFESPEALKQQIMRDVGRAQTYFRRTADIQQQRGRVLAS